MTKHSAVFSDAVGISGIRQRWSNARRWLVEHPRLVTGVTASIITVAVWAVLFWGSAIQSNSFDKIREVNSRIHFAQRQLVLSQRLTVYAPQNAAELDNADQIAQELRTEFEESHEYLSVPLAQDQYDAFLEALDRPSASYQAIVDASKAYIDAKEQYVEFLEQEIEREVDKDNRVRIWIVVVTVVLIFGLVLLGWIFIRDLKRLLESEKRMIQYLFHEIRNPLNHVINGIEGVLTDYPRLGAEASAQLQKCQEGGEFITRLLDDVLSIAKVEAGFPLDLEPTQISELCASVVRVSGLSALSSGVSCEFEQDTGTGGLYHVDSTRLSQVLVNLVSNAVKYVGFDGMVRLKLKLLRSGPSGHLLQFSVEDNGPGLSEDDRALMFEKFSTFHKTSGAGLGLHLTNLIVRRMGGKVSVESPVPGTERGTAFSFAIWLKTADDPDVTNSSANVAEAPPVSRDKSVRVDSSASPHALLSSMSGLRVLVVDDETVNVHILARKFRRPPIGALQWHVESAPSLPECLKKATEDAPFDVIFMDDQFQNDELTGSMYIRTLRARGVTAAVIMVSGNCTAADEATYRKRGAAALVPKPVPSEGAVLAIVEKGMKRHAQQEV